MRKNYGQLELEEFVKWIIQNRVSVLVDSDIPKENKRKILHRFNYSAEILDQ